jgi:hypothetical protein
MKVLKGLALAAVTNFVQAFDAASLSSLDRRVSLASRDTKCPAIWTTISADLKSMFLSGGQCNDDARAAIRANFHVSHHY